MTDPRRKERTFSHDNAPRGPRFTEEHGRYDSYRPGETSYPREQPRSRATAKDFFEPYSPSLKWESDEFKSRDRKRSVTSKTGHTVSETSPITSTDSRLEPQRSHSTSSISKSGIIQPSSEIPLDGQRSQSKHKAKPQNDDRIGSGMDIDSPSPTHLTKASIVETLRVDTQAKKFKQTVEDVRSNPSSPKPPTAYMGPFQNCAGDSGLASPAMSSGNATPRSAAVMDVQKSNRATTSLTASTPTDRMNVTFAVPSAPVNGTIDDLKNSTSINQQLLINEFSNFTQSVSEIASITVQRDLSRTAVEQKQKEFERWQVHGGDFSALSEEQGRELQHRKAAMAQLDQELKKCNSNRNQAVRAIVSSILVTSTAQTSPLVESDSTKIQNLEEQLAELKSEVQSLKASKELTQGNRPKRSSNDTENRLTLSGTDPDQIHPFIQTARIDLGRWSGIQEDVAHIKIQINALENRHSQLNSSESLQENILALREDNSVMQHMHQSLRDLVTRENDEEPGILQQIQLRKREIEANEQRISKIEEEVGSLSKSTTAQNLRIESLEALRISEQVVELTTHIHEFSDKVDGEVLRLINEQEKKDDLVGQEVERLDKAIISLQSNLAEATNQIKDKVDLVETTNAVLCKRITAQESSTSDHPRQPQMNGVQSPNWFDLGTMGPQTQTQNPKQILDEHNNRLIACETVLRNLQSRYDNLSTADLAKSMVHQMQTMYPYPVTVFNQLEQLSRSYALSLQSLAHLSADVGKLHQRLDTTAVSKPDSSSNGNEANNDMEKPLGTQQLMLFDDRLKSLSTGLEEKIPHLENSLKLLSDSVKTDSDKLQAIASTIDVAKRQYETTVESLKLNISKLEREIAQKAGSTDMEAMQKRMDVENEAILKRLSEKEEITIKDLASLHGQMTMVNHRLGITQQDSHQDHTHHENSEESIVVATHKAASSGSKLEVTDSEEDEVPLSRNQIRSMHTRKRTGKRRRSESDDSDYEIGRRRW
ncbi:hypothetical protein MMC11_001134 [Xylographa trunciseda]|nr:hypothetical protein [Xylographa trunciseda]